MLVLSQKQVTLFDRDKLLVFLRKVMDHSKKNMAAQIQVSDEALLEKFESWFKDAKSYGIRKEKDVSVYLQLCLLSNNLARWDKPDWIRLILQNAELTPGEKIERLHQQIMSAPRN